MRAWMMYGGIRTSIRNVFLALLTFALLVGTGAATALAEPSDTTSPAQNAESYAVASVHDTDSRVSSRLIFSHVSVKPGDTFRVGIAFHMDPSWHIYWQNPGDAGIPTDIQWQGENLTFGPLQWASPKTFKTAGMTSYGYDNDVVLYSEVTVGPNAKGDIPITADIDYLACSNFCTQGYAKLSRAIHVGDKTIAAGEKNRALMAESEKRVPQRAAELGLTTHAYYSTAPVAGKVDILLDVIACQEDSDDCPDYTVKYDDLQSAFIPDGYSSLALEIEDVRTDPHVARGWIFEMHGTVLEERTLKTPLLSGVFVLQDAEGNTYPVHVRDRFDIADGQHPAMATAFPDWSNPHSDSASEGSAPVVPEDGIAGAAEQRNAQAAVATPAKQQNTSNAPASGSFLWMILMAFLGGMILNLMPCVFPVLALKVSSFATLAHEKRSKILEHGAAYTLGIVLSMWVLAAVVIGLRLTGTQVGWGFQFQQPGFLVALVVILVLFSLNLFGVFEISVQPQGLSTRAAEASGVKRSVLEGVLAVVLATPCSAPFLGAAVGFALTGSTWTIIAIFTALALGLAAPLVVLTLVPGWARVLPRPGNWMNHLKTFLGFALLGSAVWILWLLGRASGVDAMAATMMFAGLLAIAVWLFGLVQYKAWGRQKFTGLAVAAAIIAAGVVLSFPLPVQQRSGQTRLASEQIDWQPWTEQGVQAALADGRPVFVDFTADWCLTCQVNKKNAIETKATADAIHKYNVAAFLADWTHENDDIRKKLKEFHRAGIPFYLVYSPDKPNQPWTLSEVITTQTLVDAFQRAAGAS